jgi:hypothetical protein
MGNLKPGATYVYEKANGVTYAREMGAPPETRQVVGYDYMHGMGPTYDPVTNSHKPIDPRTPDGRPVYEHIMEDKLWGDIHREARTNITLQKALDRAIMIYKLSKEKI